MISDIKHLFIFQRSPKILFIVGLIFWFLTGCTPSDSPTNTTSDSVSIQLSWTYGIQDSPFYAAEKNGHFEEQNLTVTLLNGGFKDGQYINALDQVKSGAADFGITDAFNLILARANGEAVVAIAAIYQRSPSVLISLADKNITRPQDLIGKRVALTSGAITWTYQAMLNTQGISLDQIEVMPRSSFGIDPLLNNEVDAMSGWIINEGIMVKEAGYEANFIVMGDYGTDTYPLVLFTTEAMIANQPQVVERFVRAMLAGMQDIVNNPNQSAELIILYDQNLDLELQRRRLQASLPFLNPDGSQLGKMQPQIWESSYQILRDQGLITEPLEIESVYNLQFWEAR